MRTIETRSIDLRPIGSNCSTKTIFINIYITIVSVIKNTYIKSIKEIIFPCLVLYKQLQILEDSLFNWDGVVVSDGIFTQEVKHNHIVLAILLLVQTDVLHTQGATAHSVRSLFTVLLIASSQGKLRRTQIHIIMF